MLPIRSTDLVLEVGSGSNPHPASDVLLEKYVDNTHRYDPMVADRPTVLADACRTPFRDKAFDYVIAFHVLEHISEPALFLNEMQRIGKAGYIETPNALFERLIPYDVHLLEVMELDGTLLIHKKSSARPDAYINEMRITERSPSWRRFFYGNPKLFHVCHRWKDSIDFKVMNPEVSCEWFDKPDCGNSAGGEMTARAAGAGLRGKGLSLLRQWYKLKKKRVVDLSGLLVCPECRGALEKGPDRLICGACRKAYPAGAVPDFNCPTGI